MNHSLLEWDSRFFGIRIEKIVISNEIDSQRLEKCLKQSNADAIYIFLDSGTKVQYQTVLENFSGKFYGQKITYRKVAHPPSGTTLSPVVTYTKYSDELLQLAYASGHLSRFYLDPRFKFRFEELYGEWVRKSLRDKDSRIYVQFDDQGMRGMVTASVLNNVGKIDLIAIRENSRGNGIGIDLLKQCEAFFYKRNVRIYNVVTQKENFAACKLYEKMGYCIESLQNVWHVWKK